MKLKGKTKERTMWPDKEIFLTNNKKFFAKLHKVKH